jgi:hypothetical protein
VDGKNYSAGCAAAQNTDCPIVVMPSTSPDDRGAAILGPLLGEDRMHRAAARSDADLAPFSEFAVASASNAAALIRIFRGALFGAREQPPRAHVSGCGHSPARRNGWSLPPEKTRKT